MMHSLFLAALFLAAITDYDGWSFLEGPTAEATGFFRVEKRDGRWRAVDPKGRGFRPMGCDHVSYLGLTCEALGYAPYHEYCKKAYPSDVEWMDETTSRLKDWGFNLLGNGEYNEKMRGRGFAYMCGVSVSGKMCQDPDADPDLYIVKGRCPGSYLPNMFSPRYAELCEAQAERICMARRNDPWLFGYYIDNELAWWCKGTLEEGLFDEVMKKPPTHSARVALEAFLDGREVTKERKVEFLHLAARRYFGGACAAIRRHDPNHLILGCRFAGLGGAHEVVWKAAGEFCDVVTFNCYPYADLERGVVLDKEGGRPVAQVVREMEAKVGKPVYITEWSFLGLDTEKPCKYGAGQRLPTQKERAKAIELFLTTLIESGCCIGWNYFMWVDLPTLGTWKVKGEDGNYGLVREDGRPYEEVTAVFRRIQRGHGAEAKVPVGSDGKRWYRGMLHMHTHFSDGRCLPEQAVSAYRDAGYDFVSITDHNRNATDEDCWMDVEDSTGKGWPPTTVHPHCAAAYERNFPNARFRMQDGKRQVRLTPLSELKKMFDADGRFLLLPGVEVTTSVFNTNLVGESGCRAVHMNVIGFPDVISQSKKPPLIKLIRGQTPTGIIRQTKNHVDRLASCRPGVPHLFMVNHPQWPLYDVLPEDLMANPDVTGFEVCNNGSEAAIDPKYGLDLDGLYTDRLWDAVLAYRCEHGQPLLYGFGSDDTHFYPGSGMPGPYMFGDGYIMVRAERLTWEAIQGAIRRGDFYAASGLTLDDVRFDAARGELKVSVAAKAGVGYRISFIVTKRGASLDPVRHVEMGDPKVPDWDHRSVPVYSERVGEVVKCVQGRAGEPLRASYRLTDEDLYVRARVDSDEPALYSKPNRLHPMVRCAWTQPYRR